MRLQESDNYGGRTTRYLGAHLTTNTCRRNRLIDRRCVSWRISISSNPVRDAEDAFQRSAARAAKNGAFALDTVANDLAPAVPARRSERMNGTLKTIKHVMSAIQDDIERLVVFVAAHFARCHGDLLSLAVLLPGTGDPNS